MTGSAIVIVMICKKREQKQRKRKEIWVKPWWLRRPKLEVYKSPIRELQLGEEDC